MKTRIAILAAAVLSLCLFSEAQAQLGIDVYGTTTVTNLDTPQIYESSGTNTSIDVKPWIGQPAFVLSVTNNTATIGTNTLTVKIQSSADGTTWADVTGGGFTTITNAASSFQVIGFNVDAVNRYIRTVYTVTGAAAETDSFVGGTVMVGRKKYQ